jgi:hypothetical protein
MIAFCKAIAYVCHMQIAPLTAVLTGDLVASRKAQAATVEAAMRQIAITAAALGHDTRFTRFRGDGRGPL